MRGGTLRAVNDFDGVLRGADLDILLRERVRNAVEVEVEGDVIVDIDACDGPLAHVVALAWQRLQSGLVEFREQAGASVSRGSFAHRPLIDRFVDGAKFGMKLGPRKKAAIVSSLSARERIFPSMVSGSRSSMPRGRY